MNRKLTLPVFALLLFAAGTAAGRFIRTSDQDSRLPSDSMPADGAAISPDEWTLSEDSIAFADAESVGTETSISLRPVSATGTTVDPVFAAGDDAVRSAIVRRFPNLAQETVDGWVETYRGLPEQELERLLSERQLMADMMPVSSFLSHQRINVFPGSGLNRADDRAAGFQGATETVQNNLLNATTPGFRRTIIRTTLPVAPSEHIPDEVQFVAAYDFTPGRITTSATSTHLAIDDDGSHWFCLMPGNLLTRHGMFARLDDGGLGIVSGSSTFRLTGDIQLPESATDMQIGDDGTLTCQAPDGGHMAVGSLQLAKVSDLTQIASQNGVYFTATTDAVITMTQAVSVQAGALEQSNVDLENERQLLQHFRQLQTFKTRPADDQRN